MSILYRIMAYTSDVKIRQRLLVSAASLICVATAWSMTTHAQKPVVTLKRYDYSHLSLLKISKNPCGRWMACFYGTRSRDEGDYAWVSERSEISSRFTDIFRILPDRVVIQETIPINGTEWTAAQFDWPIAGNERSRQLKAGCGKPPN